jgi:hypothetical protein
VSYYSQELSLRGLCLAMCTVDTCGTVWSYVLTDCEFSCLLALSFSMSGLTWFQIVNLLIVKLLDC